MSALDAPAAAAPPETRAGVDVTRGLLWREWLAYGGSVRVALAVWLVCGWVLLLFCHPGFIIAFGVIWAMVVGAGLGGGEAMEGAEEFALALPPTRSQRYLARLLLGAGTVTGFTVLGDLAIALDLPQRVWGLVVDSGFTEPFPPCEPRLLHALAVALPLAVFAFTFAIASQARSRGLVWVSWLLGALGGAAVMGVGFVIEVLLWQGLNGYASCTLLLAMAPAALLAGHAGYVRKEGINRPAPMRGSSVAGVGCIVAAVVVAGLLALLLAMYMWAAAPSREAEMEDPRETALGVAAELRETPPATAPAPRPATDPETKHAP